MEHRGVEFQVLRTISKGWRWQFQCAGVSKDGTGFGRSNAIHRARVAIDIALKGPCAPTADRHTWLVGQRVSRKDSDELGVVQEINGKIKVKWDGGK